ncbi:MAG: 5'/3'-nucleotidase SurE [Planctomycetes bacterium]|jgi:5'-nucleotidase|nr:5'/3'-nucleotidase SurE [Planctomycetota bacterium]MBT4029021.1 5'/3'-nucleotidase SurE [Planctomycetota bacterium]MBT4560359.1 5'/3'-nucleotidase SurE [Planctomycetota bacterium]MBT5102044.1 5'/3'-nucleotidase SurE [Planctomycetota bacterium]MBT5120939.1 5'/3'-nucleotidase SurE [Planctomycetota bacterium]
MKKLTLPLFALALATAAIAPSGLWAGAFETTTTTALHALQDTPQILIVNDDGIDTPGIAALAQSLATLGDVYICAPDGNRSGASHSVTTAATTMRLTAREIPFATESWALDGTPSDCTTYGLLKLGKADFDLVVSGINRGNNVGDVAHYSGTIGAAVEGALRGVPSIAVSADHRQTDYAACANVATQLAAQLLAGNGESRVVYSINLPGGVLDENTAVVAKPMGGLYFKVRGITEAEIETGDAKDIRILLGTDSADAPVGSDTEAYLAGSITITPLNIDWTANQALAAIAEWRIHAPTRL